MGGKSLYFLDLKITIDDKKLLTLVYSKPTDSCLYLDGTSCHPTKSIDEISTGVAEGLKRICSNDSDFLEQSKKYSAYLAARNHKPKQIIRAFEKINNQTRSTVQQKRAKSKIKTVTFTTQYNPLRPNMNSIIKKHLPIITDNPNLVEIFSKNSMFCAYKRFPNLKDLMVLADPYNIKPLKEIDQNPACSDCMKRCDSCKNFVDHVSSFECFATRKIFKIRRYLTCTTPNMIYLACCTKYGKQGLGSTEN